MSKKASKGLWDLFGFLCKEKCIEKEDSGVKDSHLKPFKGVNIKTTTPPKKKTPQTHKVHFPKELWALFPYVRRVSTNTCLGSEVNTLFL